jgi:hypothetical protein
VGELNLLLEINGIKPIRRDHSHADPAVYHDLYDRAAGTITTYCKLCGDFIGRRPIETPNKRTKKR